MAKLIQQPTNTSLLQPTKFQLTFARMPSVTYFCQTFNLPGLSMSEIVRSTPFVDLYVHGDKVQYEALDITFTVDEDLKTWLEMHNWITGLTFPKNFGGTVSDAVMTVMSNKNTPNIRVTFKDCFPTSVSSINFDYTMDANMILTASASFRYNYFDVDIL
jgi:hypothetical protein